MPREEVLDLSEVLRDVQGPTLNPGIQLLVVQRQVIVDEVDLTQLHDLNGHVQRDGDQHLVDRKGLRCLYGYNEHQLHQLKVLPSSSSGGAPWKSEDRTDNARKLWVSREGFVGRPSGAESDLLLELSASICRHRCCTQWSRSICRHSSGAFRQ
ncbi:hypothetical protein EYF80_017170 [Liparis tanakae]|uniref:Uncharacterized protein n=1 Tax=Liparis tanakae TaxID=230148 RepID=A0A4Z2I5Q5_9TELE|nr:hypothetical protein EYF80_017170 [Liparis tanakae]